MIGQACARLAVPRHCHACRVLAIGAGTEAGAFNPYTLEGNLLVDGVLASSHSEWVLDPAFEAVGLGRWLPLAYQVSYRRDSNAFSLRTVQTVCRQICARSPGRAD